MSYLFLWEKFYGIFYSFIFDLLFLCIVLQSGLTNFHESNAKSSLKISNSFTFPNEIPKIKLHLLEEKHKFIYCFNLFVQLRLAFFPLAKSEDFFSCPGLVRPLMSNESHFDVNGRNTLKYFVWMSNIRTKGGTATPHK